MAMTDSVKQLQAANADIRLRATMPSVRVSFTWLGVHSGNIRG